MKQKTNGLLVFLVMILLLQGCTLPGASAPTETPPLSTEEPPTAIPQSPEPTAIQHQAIPVSAPDSQPYPDVFSSDTAPEKRAPYGDSYELNRLERPFTQDMTYIPDMDISSFSLSEDGDWYYVSIGVIGKNPNNPSNIQFSVELDTNLDSFGDLLIVAQPPYSEEWTASNIKIYSDTDRDSAGVNPSKSDMPFSGNGFDSLIHSPSEGIGSDVDVAWVRINAGQYATVQFAFKKSLSGSSFFYSVLADAGLKDVARLDYVDYFTEADAGSPVRSNPNYPLNQLYAVDNTCYQAFGFKPSGFEPKVCPEIIQPQQAKEGPAPNTPGVDACTAIGSPNPGNCPWGWSDWPFCVCTPG
ncbi:MAG TPA: hypothetical protein PK152_06250 [Anaerolineales bacterium]|nr:hypothetical protein [Anaerolineae bacterium]HRJ56432.1 hypothetical protein [Anaerolineales bacterium]HRK88715.1 hypothetical protein [Anaerolineales bacterium]